MLIEIRTDGNINGSERFSDHVKAVLRTALERYGDRIRRVDVHLSDAVSNKTSHDDKCCMIEARYDRFEPIVVMHKKSTMDQAINGAVHKLKKSVDSAFRKRSHSGSSSGSPLGLCRTEAGYQLGVANAGGDPPSGLKGPPGMAGLSYYCALNELDSEIHTTHAAALRHTATAGVLLRYFGHHGFGRDQERRHRRGVLDRHTDLSSLANFSGFEKVDLQNGGSQYALLTLNAQWAADQS
jgi:ribosome-associated translation inhibitor RaiA